MTPADLRAHLLAEGVGPAVVEALMSVPRDRFVPRELRSHAWEDSAMGIGRGQTISQPTVVAVMTQAVDVGPGDVVLDVGTGSGYQAAVLTACGAHVHSVERIESLADRARETLAATGFEASVLCGDGTLGLPDLAPFDAIVVAAATREVPPALVAQLRAPAPGGRGGRLVVPLGRPSGDGGSQELVVLERMPAGLARRTLLDVVFVPLIWPGGG